MKLKSNKKNNRHASPDVCKLLIGNKNDLEERR